MGLGAYAFAGAMEGLGMSLVKLGEDKKKEAERKRQEARDDALRQDDRNYREQYRAEGWARDDAVRNEGRSYTEGREKEERNRIDGKISSAASTLTGGKADFVDNLMPLAEKVGAEIGVDPRIIVAQAALESGWGKSAPNNNFFGIKSHGRGLGANLATNEVIDGQTVRVNDSFRTYQSLEDSVRDYGQFLKENPRYREMLEADGLDAQVAALGRSGYATDPKYADKIRSIIGQIGTVSSDRDLLRVAGDPDVPASLRGVAAGQLRGLGTGADRKIVKGADGYSYYQDTGERVLPNVEREPSDEYERYVREEQAAGRDPLSRVDYAQAKKGSGVSMTMPDGTSVQVGGQATKFTEGQSKDNVYATRAEGAIRVLEPVADKLSSRADRVLDAVPLGVGREAQNDDYQVAQQAGDEFLQAILRKDTGAAITEQEQFLYGRTFLPQPGDGPAVLDAKRASRARAVEALKSGMSPVQILAQETALEKADRRVESATTKQEPQRLDFSAMSLNDLSQIDIMTLSAEQLDDMEARYLQLNPEAQSK